MKLLEITSIGKESISIGQIGRQLFLNAYFLLIVDVIVHTYNKINNYYIKF